MANLKSKIEDIHTTYRYEIDQEGIFKLDFEHMTYLKDDKDIIHSFWGEKVTEYTVWNLSFRVLYKYASTSKFNVAVRIPKYGKSANVPNNNTYLPDSLFIDLALFCYENELVNRNPEKKVLVS